MLAHDNVRPDPSYDVGLMLPTQASMTTMSRFRYSPGFQRITLQNTRCLLAMLTETAGDRSRRCNEELANSLREHPLYVYHLNIDGILVPIDVPVNVRSVWV